MSGLMRSGVNVKFLYSCQGLWHCYLGGDGRIFQTYGDSGVEYSYDFYLKDHLGSTRMVINSQDQITEAVAYQAYGAMVPLDSIANAPEIPAREKFTGKEFDQEGEDSANGVAGIQAYHFGARTYDPEIGVWMSADPVNQYHSSYAYCGANPVSYIDVDGKFGVLTHWISGGKGDAGVDYHHKREQVVGRKIWPRWTKKNGGKWKYDPVRAEDVGDDIFGNPSSQEYKWASRAHGAYVSKEKLMEFVNDPTVPEEYKRHAIDDYYNQGEGSRPLTFDESIVQGIFGKKGREKYQDTDVGWLLDPLSGLSKSLYLRGEGNVILGEWNRNPFYLVNESHKQTMHETLVEVPLSMFDPTGISQAAVATRSVVKRIKRVWNWIFK